jgi:DNA repair exonuclease SbcCD ATPase subunit
MSNAGETREPRKDIGRIEETVILSPVAGSPITKPEVIPIPSSVTEPAPGRDLSYVASYSREIQEIHAVLLDARLHNLEIAISERFKNQKVVKMIMGSPAYKDKIDEIYSKVKANCDHLQATMGKAEEVEQQEARLSDLTRKLEKQMAQITRPDRGEASVPDLPPAPSLTAFTASVDADVQQQREALERQKAAFESEQTVWIAQMKRRSEQTKEEQKQLIEALRKLEDDRRELEAARQSIAGIEKKSAEVGSKDEALKALEARLRKTEADLKQREEAVGKRESVLAGRDQVFFGNARVLLECLIKGNAEIVSTQRGVAMELSRLIETYLREVDARDLENAKRIKSLKDLLPDSGPTQTPKGPNA